MLAPLTHWIGEPMPSTTSLTANSNSKTAKIPAPPLRTRKLRRPQRAIVPVPEHGYFNAVLVSERYIDRVPRGSPSPLRSLTSTADPSTPKPSSPAVLKSSYWYEGLIYGTEIIRGLDVLELTPSEYLSEHEIAASNMADLDGVFNPQQQFPVTWPQHPQIALAYVDQLT